MMWPQLWCWPQLLCVPIRQEAWTFRIGCKGHVPDEYIPEKIKKNLLYPNQQCIQIPALKLHNSFFSSFRAIFRKPFRKISEPPCRPEANYFFKVRTCTVQFVYLFHFQISVTGSKSNQTGRFVNWGTDEPRLRYKNPNCVLAHVGAHNLGKWANVECGLMAGYICESPSSEYIFDNFWHNNI